MIYIATELKKVGYEAQVPENLRRVQPTEAAKLRPKDSSKDSFEQKLGEYKKFSSNAQAHQSRQTSAEEIMSTSVEVVSENAKVGETLSLLEQKEFQHFPVVNSQRQLVGIVSDRDLFQASPQHSISEMMTSQVFTTDSDSSLRDLSLVMLNENISSLPVLNQNHQVVGLVTRTDILKALVTKAPLDFWA